MKCKLLWGFLSIFCIVLIVGVLNLKTLKETFIRSPLALLYVENIRDGRAIDDDHLVTKLDNGMDIIVNRHDRCVCFFTRLTGHWDANETAVLNALVKPGFSIVEVGSNFGVHTLRMADTVGANGKIQAFEANPHVSKYLKQSVTLNKLDHVVTVHQKAAGHMEKTVHLSFGTANIGGGHLVDEKTNETVATEMVRLDDTFPGLHVDILKIDAEGSEANVIAGGMKIIRENPDIILMMEWSPVMIAQQSESPALLLEALKNEGFQAWKIGMHKSGKANLIPLSWEMVEKESYCDLVLSRNDLQLNAS